MRSKTNFVTHLLAAKGSRLAPRGPKSISSNFINQKNIGKGTLTFNVTDDEIDLGQASSRRGRSFTIFCCVPESRTGGGVLSMYIKERDMGRMLRLPQVTFQGLKFW